MQTLEEQLSIFNVYLNKLKNAIITKSTFSFGNKRIISKNLIDDIVCCIQAYYPVDYTEYVKRNGIKSLDTHIYFQQLVNIATTRLVFFPGYYSIEYASFMNLLTMLIKKMKQEMNLVIEDSKFKL